MKNLIDYEVSPDGGTAPAGGDGTVAAAPDPPAAATPEGEATAQSWTGPSQEEWQQTQQVLQQVGQGLPFLSELQQLLAEDPAQQQSYQQIDPNADPQAYMDARLEQMFNERFGAFEPVLGQIAEREGEQAARNELDRLASEGGDFNRDIALVVAQQRVDQMGPQQALAAGAEFARNLQKQIGDQAVEAYKQSIAAAASAPTDVSAPGAATDLPATPTGRDRYEEAARRAWAEMHPVNPAA